MGQQGSTLTPMLTEQPPFLTLPVVMAEGWREVMLRAAVFCSEIKYFGLEVTNVTSAVNSLVRLVIWSHSNTMK